MHQLPMEVIQLAISGNSIVFATIGFKQFSSLVLFGHNLLVQTVFAL